MPPPCELPWPDARHAPLPALRESVVGKPRLDVTEQLRGKHILLIGTTGFVGKVALSMLLHRYPDVGRVYCLVRPGAGNTADERFFKKVATNEAFAPLRDVHGDGYDAFMHSKVVALAGDIGRAMCNFSEEQLAALEVDIIINSAGLVSFAPSLESALRINSNGAKNVLDVARRLGAKLVHVSTCYVCGRREGEVWEDEPVVGYFPRSNAIARDWGEAGRRELARPRLRPRGRARRLPEDHRPGPRAQQRPPAHLDVPRARREVAARPAPRSRRR